MSKGLEATKRLKWGLDITQEERINLCECIEKELKEHEQYKAIEEELGIDLVTLFKAIKKGIKDYNGGSKWYVALAYNQIRDEYFLYCDFGGGYSKTRDYNIECGWVLAKEN